MAEVKPVKPKDAWQHVMRLLQAKREAEMNEEREKESSFVAHDGYFPKVPWYIVNPAHPLFKYWDLTMVCLLLFTATVTPFEVAFLTTSIDGLFVINRIVDALFIVDIVLNCVLASVDERTGAWIATWQGIMKKYFKSWLIFDLLSSIPFDAIGFYVEDDAISRLKFLRMIRLLRLLKLFRVIRASRIFSRWETHLSISYSYFSMCKFIGSLMLLSHWLACFAKVIVDLEGSDQNWISEYAYLAPDADEWTLWTTGLYWAAMTVTTIGYGDVVMVTFAERAFGCFAMIVGASLFAYIIGAVSAIAASLDEATTRHHQTLDQLNMFMKEARLPNPLQLRLRGYLHQCKALRRSQHYQSLLGELSPMLRGEVAVFCHSKWVMKVPFFHNVPEKEKADLITAVAMALQFEVYAPQETLVQRGYPVNKLYVLQRGIVSQAGTLLRSGNLVGEYMIMANCTARLTARALTYVQTSTLSRDALQSITSSGRFPVLTKIIRHEAIRLSLHTEFIHYAQSMAVLRQKDSELRVSNASQLKAVLSSTTLANGTPLSPLAHVKSRKLLLRNEDPTHTTARSQEGASRGTNDMDRVDVIEVDDYKDFIGMHSGVIASTSSEHHGNSRTGSSRNISVPVPVQQPPGQVTERPTPVPAASRVENPPPYSSRLNLSAHRAVASDTNASSLQNVASQLAMQTPRTPVGSTPPSFGRALHVLIALAVLIVVLLLILIILLAVK